METAKNTDGRTRSGWSRRDVASWRMPGSSAPRSHIATTKSAERERGIHGAKEIGKAESAWTRSASAETRKAAGAVHDTPPP